MTYPEHMGEARRVRAQIEGCQNCKLGKTANRVPFTGVTWAPKLILLGEAPGANEDRAREPFVGQAGSLLDQMLAQAGLSRHQVFIANTVCCRPPSNRNPDWNEVRDCESNRNAQIDLARTWVGVALGRVALTALLDDPMAPIGGWKGRPFWYRDKVWVPTYHPAYALRKKGAIPEITNHIKQALRILRGETEPPRPKTSGYKLKAGVLIIDHEDVKVPPKVREIARAVFTKEEWSKAQFMSEAGLAGMVATKSALGGQII